MLTFRRVALLVVIAFLVATLPVFANGAQEGGEDGSLRVGVIYLTLEHPYYQAHQRWTQHWAEEEGIELIELDGQTDAATMASQIENLIAQQVDGIIYCLIDPNSAVGDIQAAQEAGIPVVTFAIKHDEAADAPFVGIPEFEAGKLGGEEAGRLFNERFSGEQARVVTLTMPTTPAILNRSDGFFAGFQEVVPNAELVATLDGEGLREAAFDVTEDLIQSTPDVNVFYGANGDMGLGALAALESAGRGTIQDQLIVSHDGSEPEVIEIVDPESALKLAVANRPRELAKGTIDTLLEIINGERSMTNTDEIMINAAVLENDIGALQEFISTQYFSDLDLSEQAE